MITKIKRAEIADLDSLALLFKEYRIFYSYESDINAARSFLQERIQNNDSVLFISTLGESYTGFVHLYPLFSSTRMKRLWLLNDLYVAESFRGKHISKALIDAAKEMAVKSDACGLLLETAKTNTIGKRLYASTGFKLESESNFYFWPNNK
jgi:ribosomal protein S18 acetylase RimI-like enzyme